jgi:hypothetical protein
VNQLDVEAGVPQSLGLTLQLQLVVARLTHDRGTRAPAAFSSEPHDRIVGGAGRNGALRIFSR